MKFTIILLGLLSSAAFAQQSVSTRLEYGSVNNVNKTDQIGVGIQVGSLSGVAADYWYRSDASLNASITSDYGNTALGFAHVWYFKNAFPEREGMITPYIGAGGLVPIGNHSDYLADRVDSLALAAQMPLGIMFLPAQQRFGIFAEISPSLEIVPDLQGFIIGDIGGKFYF